MMKTTNVTRACIIVCLLALLTVILCIRWQRSRPRSKGITPASNVAAAKPALTTNALSNSYPRAVQIAIAAGVPLPTNPAQTREEWMKQAREHYQAQLQASSWEWKMLINFYGKVLDENGAPIAGANVHLGWNNLSPAGGETNLLTDAQGRFTLTGATGKLLVVNPSKQGYYYPRKSNQRLFEYAREYEPDFHRPDPANPVIFQLRKIGEGVDLITSRYGVRPDLGVPVPKNGTLVKVDFLERKVGNAGQMEVQNWIEPKDRSVNRNTWKFRLAIPDGGFIGHNEEFAFVAPASGYQSELVFDYPKEMTNGWVSGARTNYYIRFGNPPRYGRISVTLDGIYGGMNLEYAINPDGGRYLEPKQKVHQPPVPR
jgi:hypothetical protein